MPSVVGGGKARTLRLQAGKGNENPTDEQTSGSLALALTLTLPQVDWIKCDKETKDNGLIVTL
jgi:hypothetical protein